MRILSVFASSVLILALAGSGCVPNKKQDATLDTHLAAGSFQHAAELLEKDAQKDDILANLHYASALRCCGETTKCAAAFDKAEALYKAAEEDKLTHDAAKTASAALVNESITPYTGKQYEFCLVNAYKGMAFMRDGNRDLARVELNRALDRQRRAKDFFAAELEREKAKAKNENKQQPAPDATSPQMDDVIAKSYGNMKEFKVYADYTNPFVTYLAGLYFLLDKDYSKSVDLLKEAAAMVPGNAVLAEDLALAHAASGSIAPAAAQPTPKAKPTSTKKDAKKQAEKPPVTPAVQHRAWVIFENGAGPGLSSLTIPVPLILATQAIPYTQIDLPKVQPGAPALECLQVTAGTQTASTLPITDLTAVAETEFNARFQATLLRAMVSATTKAVMQAAGNKVGGELGKWAGTLYTAAASGADTRHWKSLPARYEVARIDLDNTDGNITVGSARAPLGSIKVDTARNHLVVVSLRTASAQPFIETIAFD